MPRNRAVLPRPTFTARVALVLVLVGCAAIAGAQIDPDDTGAGSKLGLTQHANSGQVGTVTLFKHGPMATLVVIDLASEPAGRSEPGRVERARSCDARKTVTAYRLAPVVNGSSRTAIGLRTAALLSGNYVVAVYASGRPGAGRVSCGELYH